MRDHIAQIVKSGKKLPARLKGQTVALTVRLALLNNESEIVCQVRHDVPSAVAHISDSEMEVAQDLCERVVCECVVCECVVCERTFTSLHFPAKVKY